MTPIGLWVFFLGCGGLLIFVALIVVGAEVIRLARRVAARVANRRAHRAEAAAWYLDAEQQLRAEAAPRPSTTNGPDQQPGTNDLLLAECQAIWRASSRTHRTAARLYTLIDRIGGQL
jgi:hypothetical protein